MKLLLAPVLACLPVLGAEPIRINGSDSLGAKVVPMLCEEYRKQHSELNFEIGAEGTFGPISTLLAGKIDILMANRQLNAREMAGFEEAGILLERRAAVIDVFVIAVHASNPVENLTLAQLEGLFTGEHANWKDVGGTDEPVSVHIRNTSSASYRQFQVAAMKNRSYAPGAVKLNGGDTLAHALSKDLQGIGYLGLLMAQDKALKAVKLEGIDPLGKDVMRYPLLRPCYYYHRKQARPEVRALVEWMTTAPEAKAIVTKCGFLLPGGR